LISYSEYRVRGFEIMISPAPSVARQDGEACRGGLERGVSPPLGVPPPPGVLLAAREPLCVTPFGGAALLYCTSRLRF
jgi:hypothetical protein